MGRRTWRWADDSEHQEAARLDFLGGSGWPLQGLCFAGCREWLTVAGLQGSMGEKADSGEVWI